MRLSWYLLLRYKSVQSCSDAHCHMSVPVSLNRLRKWIGYADIKTAAIYADTVQPGEPHVCSRVWN